jgi:hypothetical protein
MSNVNPEEFSTEVNDMPLEQELTGGERGKNYQASRRSQCVTIQQTDGTTIVHHTILVKMRWSRSIQMSENIFPMQKQLTMLSGR